MKNGKLVCSKLVCDKCGATCARSRLHVFGQCEDAEGATSGVHDERHFMENVNKLYAAYGLTPPFTTGTTQSAPPAPPIPPAPYHEALPRESTDTAIVGWKVARLQLAHDGTIRLGGVGLSHAYKIDDEAKHVARGWPDKFAGSVQDVPSPLHCGTCGFYATTKEHLRTLYHDYTDRVVTLEVELYGTVVEHEFGWRAQRQRILGGYVKSTCRDCGERATGLRHNEATGMYPSCGTLNGQVTYADTRMWTLADVSNLLGTELQWDRGVLE